MLLRRVAWTLGTAWLACAGVFASGTNPPAAVPVTYRNDVVKDEPWSIHVARVDRRSANVAITTALGQGRMLGMGTLSGMVRAMPPAAGRPVAAINGDFFNGSRRYPGDPEGLQIARGELISAPTEQRSCFWIDAAGNPHLTNVHSLFRASFQNGARTEIALNQERESDMAVLYTSAIGDSTRTSGGLEFILERHGTNNWLPLGAGTETLALVREISTQGDSPVTPQTMVLSVGSSIAAKMRSVTKGSTVKITTATLPMTTGAQTALGGGPALVRGGQALPFRGFQLRHPRAAFGWSKDAYFLVVVDGRQTSSAGMSFRELAAYMVKLGCTDAMNLDGGGSATFWINGTVVSSPSEGQERASANALVVVQKEPRK
jgi:exopolysaccharide biosynthesis protein